MLGERRVYGAVSDSTRSALGGHVLLSFLGGSEHSDHLEDEHGDEHVFLGLFGGGEHRDHLFVMSVTMTLRR